MPDVSNDPPEFAPLVVEQTPSGGATVRVPQHRRAVFVGAAFTAVAASALVVAAILADTEPANDPVRAATATIVPTTDAGTSSAPPLDTLAPVASRYPIGWSVVDVSEQVPELSPRDPTEDWIDWSIPVPEPLAEMTLPSTLVASTVDGVLHRIEFPSGRISSRLLPSAGATGQIAVAGDSVAVPRAGGLVIVGGDGSSVVWNLETGQIPRVTSFGSRFVATAEGGADGPARQWILDRNGTATDITDGPFARFPAWDQRFSSSGELLANDGDDVVAVDLDGLVRRIDRGRLVAVGSRHYVVRICGRRTCDYKIVDLSTGQRTAAPLGVLDAYRFFDTSIRVSPDGRLVQFADWRRDRAVLRIIDVANGGTIDAVELGDVRTPDAWAADSSGVFVPGDHGLLFHSVDGRTAVIDGLGPLRSVATSAGG